MTNEIPGNQIRLETEHECDEKKATNITDYDFITPKNDDDNDVC